MQWRTASGHSHLSMHSSVSVSSPESRHVSAGRATIKNLLIDLPPRHYYWLQDIWQCNGFPNGPMTWTFAPIAAPCSPPSARMSNSHSAAKTLDFFRSSFLKTSRSPSSTTSSS